MIIKNQIINYFVEPSYKKMPKVFLSPVTMNATVGRKLLEKQLGLQNEKLEPGTLLHVCYDVDSKRIYLPNASAFTKEQANYLLNAAKITIKRDYGEYSNEQPVEGSPFSLLRVRKLSSFVYADKSIKESFGEERYFDIPVIEANLARMPTTVKKLPYIYHDNKNYVGGLIDKGMGDSIRFIDEIDLEGRKRDKPIVVLDQQTPFILIDISPEVKPMATEKEWSVLAGYRDYLYSENNNDDKNDMSSFSDLYAAKRHLYLGWPFEEVCHVFLGGVSSFGELISAIQLLYSVAKSLESEGYKNPAKDPYYITFKIDENSFPLKLDSMIKNGEIDSSKQIDIFQIIEYDKNTGYIIIETPAFIDQEMCIKILKASGTILISRYNVAMNTIDVKSGSGSLQALQYNNNQAEKIKALINYDMKVNYPDNKTPPKFSTDVRARDISLSNPSTVTLRKLSDYYYATDTIKKMCKKNDLEFIDLDIVVGPLERIFGRGVAGGFMGKKNFEDSKMKIPYEISKGIFISPPVIAVDSVRYPAYANQTEVIIHEYSHNIFSIKKPDYYHEYHRDPKLKERDNLAYWDLYLNDEDERQAHKEEIKFALKSGKSVDEIIRDKVAWGIGEGKGGNIDEVNMKKSYPIALKFKELVQEAVDELQKEEEENERPK